MVLSQPQLVSNGVAFTASVDFIKHDCVVSTDALTSLEPGETNPMQTFFTFEANINGIARRLIAAGIPGRPLQLGVQNFMASQAV
jgi:hypothetical protein